MSGVVSRTINKALQGLRKLPDCWNDADKMLNWSIDTYYDSFIEIDRKCFKKSIYIAETTVERLLKYVNRKDSRFSEYLFPDGSYADRLMVCFADEFDFNVPLCLINGYQQMGKEHRRYYKLDEGMPAHEDRNVVSSTVSLPDPRNGYCSISLSENVSQIWKDSNDVVNNDIIPYKVKKSFQKLLSEAIHELEFEGHEINMVQQLHGPAITIKIISKDHHDISIDLVPLLPGDSFNYVAKKNFDWLISFGKIEREHMDKISEDDNQNNGCRKKCLKIMKFLRDRFWCFGQESPVITSYHLKNILFWECENYPSSNQWTHDMQGNRLMSMVRYLDTSIQKGHLRQYFNPEVNLYKEKELTDLTDAGKQVKNFLRDPIAVFQVQYRNLACLTTDLLIDTILAD